MVPGFTKNQAPNRIVTMSNLHMKISNKCENHKKADTLCYVHYINLK